MGSSAAVWQRECSTHRYTITLKPRRHDRVKVAARAAVIIICDHTIEESFRDEKSGGFQG
jgi:hypothetical protein